MRIQIKALRQCILEWATRYNWILLIGILVIHFVVQDRFWVTSMLFYATPFPVMIGFCGVCIYTYRHIPKAKYVLGGLLCVLGIVWFGSSYKIHAVPTPSGPPFTMLFWNIAYPQAHPSSALMRHLQTTPADIIGLVETGSISEDALHTYQAAFPTYTIQRLSGGMLCMTTGTINSVAYHRLPHRSHYNLLEVELDNHFYTIVLVDIGANPFFSRKASLEALVKHLPDRKHTILMGDFNTPYESMFFREYKQRYHHAFHEAGSGFAATWPYGIPLLQLDHIWTSRDILPVSFVKHYSILSDHARLEAEVELMHE